MRYNLKPYRLWFALIFAVGLAIGLAVPYIFKWGELTVRSTVTRQLEDITRLSTKLEDYRADHGALPNMLPIARFTHSQDGLRYRGGANLHTYEPGTEVLAGLTTPFAYVNDMWPDYFSDHGNFPIAYHHDGERWLLFSQGPDRLYDIDPLQLFAQPAGQWPAALNPLTYDPTNGIMSTGDIWLTGP